MKRLSISSVALEMTRNLQCIICARSSKACTHVTYVVGWTRGGERSIQDFRNTERSNHELCKREIEVSNLLHGLMEWLGSKATEAAMTMSILTIRGTYMLRNGIGYVSIQVDVTKAQDSFTEHLTFPGCLT